MIDKIWDLFVFFFNLKNKQSTDTFEKLVNILEKWNLGIHKMPIDPNSVLLKINKEDLLDHIHLVAVVLRDNCSGQLLRIILNDIKKVVEMDGNIINLEKLSVDLLEREWSYKITKESSTIQITSGTEFHPPNNLFALGYLFLATMKSDGLIDLLEVQALRENLSNWTNENARIILGAINLIEQSVAEGNILGLFSSKDAVFSDVIKESVLNCIRYLKINAPKELRKIMYYQIMRIAKADSKIHENEMWIREQMRVIWSDVGV